MKLRKVFLCLITFLVVGVVPLNDSVSANEIHFRNCSEAWAAGYGDISVGEDGYADHLDRDKDGTACEIVKSKGQYRSRRADGKPLNKVKSTYWEQVDGKWYYYENYVMVTGWKQISGTWYYFNSNGVMQTGWQELGANWYYFKDTGAMQTGWLKNNNVWYYFDSNGYM